MSKRDKALQSDFLAAAEALDGELRTFERLTDAVRRHPLSSQKHLERMSSALNEVAESDKRLEIAVRSLAEALNAARSRQQAQVETVQERTLVLQTRTEELGELQRGLEALGSSAATLTARMKEVAGHRREAPATGEESATGGASAAISVLAEVMVTTGEIADEARRLAEAAKAKDFVDLAQQADGLRQQLVSARNKLGLLQKSSGQAR